MLQPKNIVAPPTARAGASRGPTPGPRPARPPARRGIASVLAMLYLIIFSALALGFYAATTMSSQVARNERNIMAAQVAAESGMQWVRLQLASLNIPATTAPEDMFAEVYYHLNDHVKATGNFSNRTVGFNGSVISLPQQSGYIKLGPDGSRFRATITESGQRLAVKVVGQGGGLKLDRAILVEYAVAENASNIFDFGVASKSRIHLDGNARIKGASVAALGSVLSTSLLSNRPVTMDSNSEVSGDISLVRPDAWVDARSNAKIANETDPARWASHVHPGVEEPEFPTVNTAAFKKFAGNPAYGGITITAPTYGKEYKIDSGTVRNVYIKANANPGGVVVFDGNMTVEGVVYIEQPARVRFDSNMKIKGVIVVDNNVNSSTAYDPSRASDQQKRANYIEMRSNVTMTGMESLPTNSPNYPLEMRNLKGSAILAPNFYLHFNSNFGTVGGTIIGSRMHFDSNARGTVTGSVINLADTMVDFNSNASVLIESQGTTDFPAGVFFGSHYAPLPDTYKEVLP